MDYALKLNADYSPIGVVSGVDAFSLVFSGKADLVEGFDRMIRSVSAEFQVPAVIRLRKYVKGLGKVGCSRENILARDSYTCQYCGARPKTASGKPRLEDLTIDHVIPRAAAKNKRVFVPTIKEWRPVSSWENLVCACGPCNHKKGCKTVERAGLSLKEYPRTPDRSGRVQILINKYKIPEEWKDYLPQDSGWRSYWEGELED
jgi:5-methylcytosine-specific restriction endonuclease McrA